jgi:hypothetical protein
MRMRRGLGRWRAQRWLLRRRPEVRASELLASSRARCVALALDRLEARLRQLDKRKSEALVREWEGTWASALLGTPEFAGFRKPYGANNTQQRHLLVPQNEPTP